MRTACVLSAFLSMSVSAVPTSPGHAHRSGGPFTAALETLTITPPTAITERESFRDDAVSIALRSVDLDSIFQRTDTAALLLVATTPGFEFLAGSPLSAALER